ncbi:carbohydrate kinase family protein [Gordonia lacunae]|uniref:Carbohydrate kinase family protein n=1 Tax=Gordonia lacunae TaxID=417102 RepID=A0A2C9ZL63_9ACTN|nr:sugar kinase [Gordonia lacunae]OUC80986.1 carbohydrate kinase family protein [Gordonia lacunae]
MTPDSTTADPLTIATVGVHVLDIHVVGIDSIPEGSDGALVESIGFSAAGTAGGTALVLSRLGATVRTHGAIGADPIGRSLTALLDAEAVDTRGLVPKPGVQTSSSVIPVRPNGDRPAWHCIGANAQFVLDDLDPGALDGLDHLHLGGPEFLGGPVSAELLGRARDRGISTSADLLSGGDPGLLEWIGEALPHLDYLLPNDEQTRGLTGSDDPADGARRLLDRGVGCVALTRGAQGALVVTGDDVIAVAAFPVDVVDTTGCGDAFSAGFVTGRLRGLDLADAAELGCAVAAHVAQGIGTAANSYDLTAIEAFRQSRAAD